MTIEEKKQYLKQYKKAVQKINVLEQELNNIRLSALPGGIDYSKDKVQTTPTNDQMVNYMIRIEDLDKSIHELRCKAVDLSIEIINVISEIANDTYQIILHRRYILLQPWDDIAEDMHYSTQRLYELHCEALAELNIRENQS